MKRSAQDAATAGTEAAADKKADLQTRLLHLAFVAMPETALLSALAVPPFAYLLWPLFAGRAKEVWALALALSIVSQAAVLWAWRQRGPWQAGMLWRWRVVLVLVYTLAGLAWGSGPCLILAQADAAPSILLVGILFLVCAVASSSQAAQPWAMYGFITAALAPSAVAALLAGGDVKRVAGILLLAGLAALIVVGRRSGLTMVDLQLAQSKLNAALAETSAARQKAESASQAKTRFLANMSHELRTPLNAVIGAAQLLRTEAASSTQQSHLVDAIQRGGNNLLGLIENVLDLSRIEAGEMPLHLADFHLVECVEAALSTAALVGRSKGLKLACIIDPKLPAWRHGDPARVRQVVLNLLGNAVKFTDAGEVLVRVSAGAELDEAVPAGLAPRVRITVSDTGVGISEDALRHIFEPFRQAEEQASRRFGGSGLGLAIAQQLVLAMDGSIHAESLFGSGSSFEIELPLPLVQNPATEQPALALRVAFFEPHEPSAQALQAHLLRMACESFRFADAAPLRSWLARGDGAVPSWVLMAADAPQCQAMLESLLDVLDLSQLVLMADEGTGLADHARVAQGLSRQLLRPLTRTALVSALQPRPLLAANLSPPAEVPPELMSPTQLQALTHVLVVEDDELNRDIVSGLLRHAGFRVSVARDGPEALQMMRSLGCVDLVFMDWQMPGMDGLEATRLLRGGAAGTAGQTVPIVALTANAFAEDRAACLAAGMNDFVTKPVLAEKLYGTVRRWAARRPAAQPETGLSAELAALVSGPIPSAPVPQSAPTPSAMPLVLDRSVLRAMPMVADGTSPELPGRLLTLYMSGAERLVERVKRATDQGDLQALRHALHELKSSSGMVGAHQMQALATEQEMQLRQGQGADTGLGRHLSAALAALRAEVAARP
jgi:two-component system, sensor histidine kinase and response regulator